MKKNLLFLYLFLAIFSSLNAQIQFDQVPPPPPAPQMIADFDGVYNSSIAFADVDGDGVQDVLITGKNSSNQIIAKLYSNDGSGNFSLVSGTPFDGVISSSIAFADVDNDGDEDVLVTGYSSSGKIAKLYSNDGSGNFSLVSGTPFDGVGYSSIAFSDVDGDGDEDVLITGQNSSNQIIAKLYSNDGSGNFSLVSSTPFEGVYIGSIAFSDVDGDGDEDVIITGDNSINNRVSKLYSNDGNGSFSLEAVTPFDGVNRSSIAFSDVDGDGDEDVLITGLNSSNQIIAKLYSNDGSGNFSLVSGTPFDGVHSGSIAFLDVDGDGNQDVLITGQNSSNQRIAKLYSNDGSGNFSLVIETFDGVQSSSIAFSDVDGDGDEDVLITGYNSSNQRIAKLYSNDGSGNFSLVSGTPFDGVWYSSIAFSDIDGDGDEDVLITGQNSSNQRIAKLYSNDGSGNFSLVSGTPFDGVIDSSIAFSDVDGDGDQDVLITGLNSSNQSISKLYSNDGSGNFSLVIETFDGVQSSSIAFSDVDGDGDEDVLITGYNSSNQFNAKLYSNDGSGNFSLVIETFDAVQSSSIAFSDVDGDGDEDVLITGYNSSNQRIAKLYSNDGIGNFSLVSGTPFDGVSVGSIAFADVDGDGDEDVLVIGYSSSGQISKLYSNEGSGNFSLVSGTSFEIVYNGSIAFSDVDGDGDEDILITGSNSSNQGISKLYRNNTSYISTESQSDGDWSSISWSNGTPDGTLYQPIISNAVTLNDAISIRDLQISSGGVLDINSNVTVISDVSIQSNASLKGQQYLTINGDLSIERQITGYSSSSDGWHFLSSPVSNQTISGSDFVPTSGDDLYEWGESSGEWLNYSGGSFGDSEFEAGKAYLVAYDNTATKEFTGNFNTGSVTQNLSYTAGIGDGWNLLGNPYPSAIDWDLITRSGDVDNAAYIVNPTDGTYKSWVEGVGDITDGEIPVNQGFFVKANSGGQSVTMELADQVHSSNQFNKSNQELPENTLKIGLNAANSENNTYVRFKYNATEHFDSHADAYKLFGFAEIPQVYTHLEETDYSINALNFSTEAISIPLGIYLNTEEDLSFNFTGLDGFDANTRIELEDKTANKIIHLREQSNYSFRGTPSDEAERFVLHFSQVTGLEDLAAQDAQVYAAAGRVYIRLEEGADYSHMSLFDLSGRLISEQSLSKQSLQSFDFTNLKGVYLVQLQGENGSITEKVTL